MMAKSTNRHKIQKELHKINTISAASNTNPRFFSRLEIDLNIPNVRLWAEPNVINCY
jgi:hypothetical protein